MRRHEPGSEDERLRELFHEMRDEDEVEAPPFRSSEQIREKSEESSARVRRVAYAASLAVVMTAVLAAIATVPRRGDSGKVQVDSPGVRIVTENRHVPPSSPSQPRAIERAEEKPPAVEPAVATSDAEIPEPPPPVLVEPAPAASMVVRVVDATDQSPLPAATVVLTNAVQLVAETVTQTDINGVAEFPVLRPGGAYAVQVTMPGYAGIRRDGIRLAMNQDQTLLFPLRDEITEIEVLVATLNQVDLEKSARTTFGDEYISDLPPQGRFYTNVLTLAPGVQDTDMDGNPNVHSARERDFSAIVGGVASAGPSEAERALRTVLGLIDQEPRSAESYAAIEDNPFHVVTDEPLSTFSADVDTASYSNVRRFLRSGRRPPRDAVRIEELINYFAYDAAPPRGDDPFGVAVEVADCPWNPAHRLAWITLAARRDAREDYAGSNLVFLLDVSGSMQPPNKLPLVKEAMSMLAGQLDGRDTVSIVVYAGASGLVLPPTSGSDRAAILESLRRLDAGGGTAGASGLRLAYRTARENFIEGGVNRVILATDGDFNVGVTGHAELLSIIEKDAKRGVFLTALGFGMGNYQDDRLEQLADRGNGNYAYIDDLAEARKVLVEEIGGTLVTVAKDVKLQVEFNPKEVGAYRLIGYENRLLAHRDFNDDTKDAGEIGAGHTVTVLYELVPPGEPGTESGVDPLRYQRETEPTEAGGDGELFTLKIRFKPPHGSKSGLLTYPVHDDGLTLGSASDNFRFAAAVAAFGMRLRDAASARDFDWSEVERLAAGASGVDEHGHRAGFLSLVRQAAEASE